MDHLDLLKTVFDTIDEPIYIVDLETDRIVFANKKIETLFGSVLGEYCWESLQKGQKGPCSFCTNHYLIDNDGQPTGVHQSTYQNTFSNRWFQCSDQAFTWHDGRMVAIKTSVDVTELKESILSMTRLLNKNEKLARKIVASIDNERRQLSQYLHDEIGQIGTAIRLDADFLLVEAKKTQASDSQRNAIKDIVKLSTQFLDTIRGVSTELNPRSMILHLTIYEVLQGLFNEWLNRNRNLKGNITFNFNSNLDVGIAIKEALYRVMQETLTNISRHSKASQVSVLCSTIEIGTKESEENLSGLGKNHTQKTVLKLIIDDNGVGFPEEPNNCCLGLVYMEGRVKTLGGNFQKNVSSMGGAQIQVQVPYPQPRQ